MIPYITKYVSLSRNHHRVWSPTHRRAIKEESKVANRDWVDNQACSKPRVLFALFTVFWMWVPHDKSFLIVTPRFLLESYTSIVWPCSSYLTGSSFFFFVEILNTTHLMGLKIICQVFSKCSSTERSFWRRALSLPFLGTLNRRLSSANSLAWEYFIDSGKSLMKHKNNMGPRTFPWGTPKRTSAGSDLTPPRITRSSLWLRKDSIHRLTFPLTL